MFLMPGARAKPRGLRVPPLNAKLVPVGTDFDVTFMRGYLGGLTLSNDGTSPNTVLDIAAGVCTDSNNVNLMKLPTFTKSTGGAWVAGSGNNGMGTGLTIANSTWYHVFVFAYEGLTDIYFDTSATAANKPGGTGGFQSFRRIGSFKTDGSAHIIAFTQVGDEFIWAANVADVSGSTVNQTATTFTLASIPTGLKLDALLWVNLNATGAGWNGSVSSPDITTVTGFNFNADAAKSASQQMTIRTNTSAQINAIVSTTGGTANIWSFGWIDTRGKLS